MHTISPQVNLNGTSRRDLILQQVMVIDAIDGLIMAIRDAAPHRRDYQIDPPKFASDRGEFSRRLEVLYELKRQYSLELSRLGGK